MATRKGSKSGEVLTISTDERLGGRYGTSKEGSKI